MQRKRLRKCKKTPNENITLMREKNDRRRKMQIDKRIVLTTSRDRAQSFLKKVKENSRAQEK